MKLWLQVLFAQGYLWRDRFPDAFAETKVEHQGPWSVVLLVLAVAVLGMSLGLLAAGEEEAFFMTPMAVLWVAWSLASRGLRAGVRWTELRISLTWTLGFLFSVSAFAMLAEALVATRWQLLALGVWLTVCLATGCLRGIQRNYLLFRQPGEYAWVLEGPGERPKGIIAPYADAIAETYWRLPRQILFPQRERHAQ